MNVHEEVSRYAPRDVPGATPDGQHERWEIDLGRSRLGFTLRHLVLLQIRGQFRRWGGTLFLDRAEPSLSSIQVWVDLASVETDSAERDEHIRSAEFLDVEHLSRAEFKSTAVELKEGRLLLRGRLQLHGVTQDVELEVQVGSARSGAPNAYEVRGKIDRQRFGLRWNQDLDVGGVVVGDDVELAADVELAHRTGP